MTDALLTDGVPGRAGERSTWRSSLVAAHWLVLPALAFAAVVYFPITQSYFYLDDFLNLYHIVNEPTLHYLIRENGGHILLTRNTLFYLTFALAGPHPALFYWSALLTHLLNVVLLYVVLYRLTGRRGLASFGAAFWGISPLNEGTLGWYSVHGHAVVGTALLIVLTQASGCVVHQRAPSAPMRWLWYLLAIIAATSFGTGTAVAMVLPFALWLLLIPLQRRPPLLSLLIVIPTLYIVLIRLHELATGAQAPVRALASNGLASLPAALALTARVTGFGVTRWATGFTYSPPAQAFWWYVALCLFILAVLLTATQSSRLVQRQLGACALIVAAAYGSIGVGRGTLMHTAADSTISMYSRYHYVAPIALTIMLCLVLAQVGQRVVDRRVGLIALAAWYAVAVVSFWRSGFRIDRHDTDRQQTHEVLASIQSAIEAQPPGATVRIENAQFPPFPLSFVPGWAGVFTIFYPSNVVDGRRVVFIDRTTNILAHHGRRISQVLVPPP